MHAPKLIRALMLLPILTLAACKPATVSQISITNLGSSSTEVIDRWSHENAPEGKVHQVDQINFSSESLRVPAKLGAEFGFQYVVKGEPKGSKVYVTHSATHPEITDPKTGKTYSSISYQQTAIIGNTEEPNYFGYGFDYEWELAPGDWVLRVTYGESIVAEQTFTVYKP